MPIIEMYAPGPNDDYTERIYPKTSIDAVEGLQTALDNAKVKGIYQYNITTVAFGSAIGSNTKGTGNYSLATGYGTTASGGYSFTLGYSTIASANQSFAGGNSSNALSPTSFSFGTNSLASSSRSYTVTNVNTTTKEITLNSISFLSVGVKVDLIFTESAPILDVPITAINGNVITVNVTGSISPTLAFVLSRDSSLAGGYVFGHRNVSAGEYAFSSGAYTISLGRSSQAFGESTKATSSYSFAIGNGSLSSGTGSFAGGIRSTSTSTASLAFGFENNATSAGSVAIGANCQAIGERSFALGSLNKSYANYSFALGQESNASAMYSVAMGHNNKPMNGSSTAWQATHDAFVIGNGFTQSSRSNAFRITMDGKVYGLSAFNSTGADYAEFFEWADGNAMREDRVGFAVSLVGDKIQKAKADDEYFLGIISATPSVVGDSHQDDWNERYLKDEWGRVQYHWVDVEYDKEQSVIIDGKEEIQLVKAVRQDYVPVENPDFDPTLEYIPREKRKEWGIVGLMGKLLVRDDGLASPNQYVKVGSVDGTVTLSDMPTNMRVLKRINETIIQVYIK